MIKRRLATLAAAAAAIALVPAGASVAHSAPADPVAKTCSGSYTHAVINSAEKCLRRGEFCAHAAARQYRRYGFSCTRRDATGRYHLT